MKTSNIFLSNTEEITYPCLLFLIWENVVHGDGVLKYSMDKSFFLFNSGTINMQKFHEKQNPFSS